MVGVRRAVRRGIRQIIVRVLSGRAGACGPQPEKAPRSTPGRATPGAPDCAPFVVCGPLCPFDSQATAWPFGTIVAEWNPLPNHSDAVDNRGLVEPRGTALHFTCPAAPALVTSVGTSSATRGADAPETGA